MKMENITKKLHNLLLWEDSEKDTYQLEVEFLQSIAHLKPNEKVKVIIQGQPYIIFVDAFEEEDFETKAYYYSKLETNIPLENGNKLFLTLAQLLNN